MPFDRNATTAQAVRVSYSLPAGAEIVGSSEAFSPEDLQTLSFAELDQRIEAHRRLIANIKNDALANDGRMTQRDERRLDQAEESLAIFEAEMSTRPENRSEAAAAAARGRTGPGRKTSATMVDNSAAAGATTIAAAAGALPIASVVPQWRDKAGNVIRCLSANESIASTVRQTMSASGHPAPVPNLGEVLRAMVIGDWSRAGEMRNALSEGNGDATGGVFVLPVLSSQLIDLARAQSVVFKAGAKLVPMSTNELDFVRVTSDPTPAWVAELGQIPVSAPGFARMQLIAHRVSAICGISRELAEDGVNAAAQIQAVMEKAMAAEIDRAALFGSGSGAEPLGLFNTAGLGAIAVGGAMTYAAILEAIATIEAANFEPNAWISSPHSKYVLAGTTSTTGEYLTPPPDVTALQRLVTSKMANASDIVGDFSQLFIGSRLSGIQFETSTQALDAFDHDIVYIKARARIAVAVAHPTAFVKLTGIT